jgi:cytochrome c-type biogenesis protein CcmH
MKRLVLVLAVLCAGAAFAVEPSEMLPDPALEARAREVSQALRCVVCQNETIDESNAELAKDMRLMVRRRIMAGDTNAQVLQYMVQRYGDFVLLNPRFTGATVVLWAGPLLILILGGIGWYRVARRRTGAPAPLTAEEAAHVAALKDDPS